MATWSNIPNFITGQVLTASTMNQVRDNTEVGHFVCTSASRPASPGTGQMIFETDTNKVLVWNASAWVDVYPATLPTKTITSSLPSSPSTGDEIIYKHSATGNIDSHLPMIYDGTQWQPMGEAILCRWNSGSATQVFSSTSVTNVTVGDYNTVTFTPPWDGYYEISQKTGMWELNSGIGMQTLFSATDGSAHLQLHYVQDWNGPYQHHREGHGMPIVYYLYSAKTYRFTANITYASGNTGTINFYGTAHVRALSR